MAEPPFRVGVARCLDYEPSSVKRAFDEALKRAGGWPEISGNVLVKPNLLAPRDPNEAVTTHPEVVTACVQSLKELTQAHSVTVGDSPGYVYEGEIHRLLEKTGMKSLEEKGVASMAPLFDQGFLEVEGSHPLVLDKVRVCRRYLNADAVINVAKFKTHVETEITACLKNLFGIADTATRKKAHRSRSQLHLADAILDLYSVRKPDFNVLDAVWAMEGKGPSWGTPCHLGWLLVGRNALAVDEVALWMAGYDNPRGVPLIRRAIDRQLGPSGFQEIELIGASWNELRAVPFKKAPRMVRWIPTPLRGWGHRLVSLNPLLDSRTCTRCGVCSRVCPVGAIEMRDYPFIKKGLCVSCLCCHEMCPTGAMRVRPNLLAKILLKGS